MLLAPPSPATLTSQTRPKFRHDPSADETITTKHRPLTPKKDVKLPHTRLLTGFQADIQRRQLESSL